MNITKYYRFEKGQSNVAIPIKLAQDLGWKHKDDLEISIEVINGKKGLFLRRKGDK